MLQPRAGDAYQVCVHLVNDAGAWNFWRHPEQPVWIVLCDGCHEAYQDRQGVEIFGEAFVLRTTPALDAGSSVATHARPPVSSTASDTPLPTRR